MEYLVTWAIDVDADDPRAAAVEALDSITREGSIAHVFEVSDGAVTTLVDLDA